MGLIQASELGEAETSLPMRLKRQPIMVLNWLLVKTTEGIMTMVITIIITLVLTILARRKGAEAQQQGEGSLGLLLRNLRILAIIHKPPHNLLSIPTMVVEFKILNSSPE